MEKTFWLTSNMPMTTEKTVVLSKDGPTTKVGIVLGMFTKEDSTSELHPRITSLQPDGIASLSGELEINDMVVSVNGVICPNADIAAQLILDCEDEVELCIRRTAQKELNSAEKAQAERIIVTLPPSASDLGIEIETSPPSHAEKKVM